jgi:hypothetical protein
VSENCAETRPSFPLTPAGRGDRPLLMGTGTVPGDALPKLGRNRSDLPYTIRCCEAKMEIPDTIFSRFPKWKSWLRVGRASAQEVSQCVPEGYWLCVCRS